MIYDILASKPHNKHHLSRYIKFISSCISHNANTKPNSNIEKHHICPKAKDLFPEYKSLYKFYWNCALLTTDQHYVAHRILASVYPIRSMIAAFIRMTKSSSRNRSSYSILRKRLSDAMITNNPMHDPDVVEKAKIVNKNSWTEERRSSFSKSRLGICNISQEGLNTLSKRWLGVKRPKTAEQILKNKIATSIGIFHTPYGDFYSPADASKSELNLQKYSRAIIDKKCKNYIDGYSFTKSEKDSNRGRYKRK